ncbi:MAG: hypothetical protein M3004_12270 [Bacteroidota bacterium]|nr:hypothetical protein [Bacteroidota bacterium]
MKSIKNISVAFKGFIAILMLCLVQTITFAQDNGGGKVDVNITKSDGNWYAQPWVWIVGGAVFLLLLVALMRSNSNKD